MQKSTAMPRYIHDMPAPQPAGSGAGSASRYAAAGLISTIPCMCSPSMTAVVWAATLSAGMLSAATATLSARSGVVLYGYASSRGTPWLALTLGLTGT